MTNIVYIGSLRDDAGERAEFKSIREYVLAPVVYQQVLLDNGVKLYTMTITTGKEYLLSLIDGGLRPLSMCERTITARRIVTGAEIEQWRGKKWVN